jgi:DNA-binding NarL/FixJ family response regulator
VVITLRDAIAAIRLQRWAALFVDPGLPDGSGLDTIAAFRDPQPFAPVLVLTGGASAVERERAWSLGARYVEKPDVSEALVEDFLRSGSAFEALLTERATDWHNPWRAPHQRADVVPHPKRRGLPLGFDTTASTGADLFSDRERDIVLRLSLGQTPKAIAYDLGLSPSTVRVHLGRAAAKIGARSRRDLIEQAAGLGLPPTERFGRSRGGLRSLGRG